MDKAIYFDNAATTPVRQEVLDAMLPYFSQYYGNASSAYKQAKISKKAIEKAREQVAFALNAAPDEIYFTSGGTESDNWAITGFALALKNKGRHMITSAIEHRAVLRTCQFLEKNFGYDITYLPVNKYGVVSPNDVKKAVRQDTVLISVMFANNEIGSIQPIAEIGKIARERGIYFHTDAVQAIGHIDIDVNATSVDSLSLSGHKLGAPKGVGALYIKNGANIEPFMRGGGQEKGLRAGTENVAGIVGLGKAAELAKTEIRIVKPHLEAMRNRLINGVMSQISDVKLNGHPTQRLPNNVNLSFKSIDGGSLLLSLQDKGIYASSGSACAAGSSDPSYVLLAIGLTKETARGSLRLTLSRYNSMEEVNYLIKELPPIARRLRGMSDNC